jgi:type IV pilus assembly protein PilZ
LATKGLPSGIDLARGDRRVSDEPVAPAQERRSGAERRKDERVEVDLEVDYRADDTFLFAYITDISAMGIFVRTNTPEPPGTRLNLRFTPPGGEEPLEFEGEVIWINPLREGDLENRNPGMGIQFVELAAEQRDRILQLVKTFAYLDDDKSDRD